MWIPHHVGLNYVCPIMIHRRTCIQPGGMNWGGGVIFYTGLYREKIVNYILKNHLPGKIVTLMKTTPDNVDSNS